MFTVVGTLLPKKKDTSLGRDNRRLMRLSTPGHASATLSTTSKDVIIA